MVQVLVVFDNPSATFESGGTLSGNVIVKSDRSINITEIKVKIAGRGNVRWTEGSFDKSETYSNSEKYLKEKQILRPMDRILGEVNYPFHFTLPSNLPQSFVAVSGKVTYKCKVSVSADERISLLSNTCTAKVPFEVRAVVDTRIFPGSDAMASVCQSNRVPFCCICCCCISAGKVTAALSINKGAYMPGENIVINAEVTNHTSSMLMMMKAVLQQVIIFKNKGIKETKTVTKDLKDTRCELDLRPGTNFVWSNAILLIPCETPPTNLGGCNIMEVNYQVLFVVGENEGCCDPKTEFKVPIFIGSFRPPEVSSGDYFGSSFQNPISFQPASTTLGMDV